MNIIFFGSFQHYSALILESLNRHAIDLNLVGVVTTPPKPIGKKQILTKTPVHLVAEKLHLPVFTPDSLNKSAPTVPMVDFFLVAGYGKLLPPAWLKFPKFGSLNLHFSLLPKFRGANPAEWALLLGEKESGITLMTMAETFDTGAVISQRPLPLSPSDTRETVYQKLYMIGAQHLPTMLVSYFEWVRKSRFDCQTSLAPKPQPKISPTPPALRFTKDQSFVKWELIMNAQSGHDGNANDLTPFLKTAYEYCKSHGQSITLPIFLERAVRALSGFPGLWTIIKTSKGDKRLKVLSTHLQQNKLVLDYVQLEGYSPANFNQIKNQIIHEH